MSSRFVRENSSILSRQKSFTQKLTIKLDSTFFHKSWPSFEKYARVIFIHDVGRKLTTFCAFYKRPRIYGNIAMICVRKEAQVLFLTFGLKVARYCPLQNVDSTSGFMGFCYWKPLRFLSILADPVEITVRIVLWLFYDHFLTSHYYG